MYWVCMIFHIVGFHTKKSDAKVYQVTYKSKTVYACTRDRILCNIVAIADEMPEDQDWDLSIQPEYHVYNTCIGVGEWPFILSPDLLYSFLRLQVYFHLQLL